MPEQGLPGETTPMFFGDVIPEEPILDNRIDVKVEGGECRHTDSGNQEIRSGQGRL
jgi:hypothetical protein